MVNMSVSRVSQILFSRVSHVARKPQQFVAPIFRYYSCKYPNIYLQTQIPSSSHRLSPAGHLVVTSLGNTRYNRCITLAIGKLVFELKSLLITHQVIILVIISCNIMRIFLCVCLVTRIIVLKRKQLFAICICGIDNDCYVTKC